MHLECGAEDCSVPAVQRLYVERYPTRRIPRHNSFASLPSYMLRKLAEAGSFRRAGRKQIRITRTPAIEQNVLQQEQETPSTSTRSLVHAVRVSRFSVWRILREHDKHKFYVQCVQTLQPDDYVLCIAFLNWYLGKCAIDPRFLDKVVVFR